MMFHSPLKLEWHVFLTLMQILLILLLLKWGVSGVAGKKEVFRELPITLQAELSLNVNSHILEKVRYQTFMSSKTCCELPNHIS